MKSYSRLNSTLVAEIMTKGRAVHTSSFLMKYIEGKEGDPSGLAFISPKKGFKSAVVRNKARRRGRAALQTVMKRLDKKENGPNKKSFFVVFLLKPIVLTSPLTSLQEDIQQSLSKSGIMQNL